VGKIINRKNKNNKADNKGKLITFPKKEFKLIFWNFAIKIGEMNKIVIDVTIKYLMK
jgi:adenylate kinase